MGRPWTRLVFAAAFLLASQLFAAAEPQVDSLRDVFARLGRCWKPPEPSQAHPGIDITVMVSFNRSGEILGHPRITYESDQADDNDRLVYRIAVMETLKRCTPMPFSEGMAGAIAGRPIRVQIGRASCR